MDEPEIQPWTVDEAPALEAFELPAADEADEAELFRPRAAAQWDWAFRANPAGVRLFLARRAGRSVACCGALPVRTRVLGETRTFACLLPARLERGEDERVLVACARALTDAHARPEGDLVHYGWPAARAARLLKRELGYELLRVQCLFARECAPGAHGLPPGVEELLHFGPEADVLYACCATHWHASTLRDAAFLNWRFVHNPFQRYRLLGVRSGAVLRGYAVVRAAPELAQGLGLLVDWLVLPGDEEASESLLAAVLACARAQGVGRLETVLPEWSPWAQYFQERGFRHSPGERLQLMRSSVPRFDMLWLRDNWWNTLADVLFL